MWWCGSAATGAATGRGPGHTVVIQKVLGSGNFQVLEQNWDGNKPDGMNVRVNSYNLNDMTSGTYWIYQPVAR